MKYMCKFSIAIQHPSNFLSWLVWWFSIF